MRLSRSILRHWLNPRAPLTLKTSSRRARRDRHVPFGLEALEQRALLSVTFGTDANNNPITWNLESVGGFSTTGSTATVSNTGLTLSFGASSTSSSGLMVEATSAATSNPFGIGATPFIRFSWIDNGSATPSRIDGLFTDTLTGDEGNRVTGGSLFSGQYSAVRYTDPTLGAVEQPFDNPVTRTDGVQHTLEIGKTAGGTIDFIYDGVYMDSSQLLNTTLPIGLDGATDTMIRNGAGLSPSQIGNWSDLILRVRNGQAGQSFTFTSFQIGNGFTAPAPTVVDNTSPGAATVGVWSPSTFTPGFVGPNYFTDGNTGKGTKTVTYTPDVTPGAYEIELNSVGGTNRATNVPVDIYTAGSVVDTVTVNEQSTGYIDLGNFTLDANSKVVIRTTGTNGFVIANALQFIPVVDVPLVGVSGNGLNIPNNDATAQPADGTAFGTAAQNGAQVNHTFTITNPGGAALTVGTVGVPSGYTLVTAPAGTIAPGGSTTFTVGLTTGSTGTFSGNVTFSTNVEDGVDATFNFAVSGTVSAATTVVIDNTSPQATVAGAWSPSTFTPGFVGPNYLTDGNAGKGTKTVSYAPGLAPGAYAVSLNSVGGTNRATDVPVDVYTAGGAVKTIIINEQSTGYILLGTFSLDANSRVVIRTDNTNGYVIADAVKFVPATALNLTVVDNTSPEATVVGSWSASSFSPGFVGSNYLTDGNIGKGTKSVTYAPGLATGSYQVYVNSIGGTNRATNVRIEVIEAGGVIDNLTVNEQNTGLIDLGTFDLDSSSKVEILNVASNGYVIADAVEFEG